MTRDEMRRNQQLPDVGPIADGVILALWRQGLDTMAIAEHTKIVEHQIYNRLSRIRETAQ